MAKTRNKKISMKKIASLLNELTSEKKLTASHSPVKNKRDDKIEELKAFFKNQRYIYEYPHSSDKKLDAVNQKINSSIRRLYKIKHHPESGISADFYLDGYNSAQSIAGMGRANFIAQYGTRLGDNTKLVHAKAVQQSMMALTLFAKHSPVFNPLGLAALPSPSHELLQIPEWKSLFGSLNQCKVEEGNSVLSPAAYLVDLLHFLSQQELISLKGEKKKALDILLERRPDIAWLELTGKNTFTMLPYVDIVTEALESAFFPLKFDIKNQDKYATQLDKGTISDDLKKEFPTNFGIALSNNARVTIEEQGAQWRIDDNIWTFVINIGYENTLNVSSSTKCQTKATTDELAANPEYLIHHVYDKLLTRVYPWNLPFDLWAEAAHVYLKHLGIPRYRLMEIFHPENTEDIPIASEYLGFTKKERDIITGKDTDKSWQYWGLEEIGNRFNEETGLPWNEALEKVPVFLERSAMEYDQLIDLFDTKFINPKNSIKINFFNESDTALSCDLEQATISNINKATFNRIHCFMRLQRKSGWSVQELDKVIRVLQWEDINEDLIKTIRYLRELQTELDVSLDELLSWYVNIDTVGEPSFYDQLFLNKTVLRPVDEDFELNEKRDDLKVSGDTKKTIKDHASTILAALNISDTELDIILSNQPTIQDLNLDNLSSLYRIVSLSRSLELSIEDFFSLKEMSSIDPFNHKKIADTQRFIRTVHLIQDSGFSFPELDYLVCDIKRPKANIAPIEEDITEVLSGIHKGLKELAEQLVPETASGDDTKQIKKKNYVKQNLSSSLSLEFEVMDKLLDNYLMNLNAIELFLNLESVEVISSEKVPEPFALYQLLHHISLLIDRFKLDSNRLDWLFPNERTYLTLDVITIPFNQWERLVYLNGLHDRLGKETLSAILDEKNVNEKSNISKSDFDCLKENKLIPENSQDTEGLRRLLECMTALKRLDVAAGKILQWTASDISSDITRDIKQAVKAKYDEQQWRDVAKPLEDRLREKRREVLVSYHMAENKLYDTHDLYQYLLLDVEMSPCMMTSRLKLAISSVQLFVQRCLMNIEQYRIPSASQAQEWKHQWEWMKNYRVWEANRKIFLYPENWIEPELRRDKTPFFKDLENELLQGEMTTELAERAFQNYLEKLNDVARLEICGLYHEKETSQPSGQGGTTLDVLHVFGRTRGMPKAYYYRHRSDGVWTAWEQVMVDIEGDHLIPAVFNRRLHIFWPMFTEKTEPLRDKNGAELKDKYGKQKMWESWEVSLAFSEYRQGMWSAKKILDKEFIIDSVPESDETKDEFDKLDKDNKERHLRHPKNKCYFTFKTLIADERLLILCALRKQGEDKQDKYEYKGGFRFICDNQLELISEDEVNTFTETYPITSPEEKCFYENMVLKSHSDSQDLSIGGKKILSQSPSSFTLIFAHQLPLEYWQDTFFYQDAKRVLFVERKPCGDSQNLFESGGQQEHLSFSSHEAVEPQLSEPGFSWAPSQLITSNISIVLAGVESENYNYDFENAYHPLVYEYMKRLKREGVYGLLRRHTQQKRREPLLFWLGSYERSFFQKKDSSRIVSLFEEHKIDIGKNPTVNEINTCGWIISAVDKKYRVMKKGDGLAFYDYDDEQKLLFFADEKEYKNIVDANDEIKTEELKAIFNNHSEKVTEISNVKKIADLWEITGQKQDDQKEFRCFVNAEEDGLYVYQDFKQQYDPNMPVVGKLPQAITEFESGGLYAQYNWELFFHAPLLIADSLSKNQRFEEAQQWFHYIFNPVDCSMYSPPHRYWQVLPFFRESTGKPIRDLMALLGKTGSEKELEEAKERLLKQLRLWKKDPFEPHLIAQLRLGAYQKTVVMKYIDNLIPWGDQLFRRDTIETINEATQLYVLAAEILGKRPTIIPQPWDTPKQTFEEIKKALDDFSNGPTLIEERLPETAVSMLATGINIEAVVGTSLYLASATDISQKDTTPYFGIPQNDNLLSYWGTVTDRLFKIRHCLNIEGVERKLALFEPPIEPGLLMRAREAGVDISSALSDISVALPYYRFGMMMQKALQLCEQLKELGEAFLSALKDKDTEGLAHLKMGQVGPDLRVIKKKQVEEITLENEVLEYTKQIAKARRKYVQQKHTTNAWEYAQYSFVAAQKAAIAGATVAQYFASSAAVIPDIYEGAAGISSPLIFAVTVSGGKIKGAADSWAKGLEYTAKAFEYLGKGAELMAKHQRNVEECEHQEDVISQEIEQIKKKLLASQIRLDIAQKELENYELEEQNASEVDAYMRDRFTNLELYNWRVSKLSTLYFQSYQMAYDLAKRAEEAFRYELGGDDTSYIQFGYWDSLRKGLLAGEKLLYDLKRMEAAYLEQNKRNYEITKHISLAIYFPYQLIKLREEGKCDVELSETFFDLDYPGHYMRLIKSVSLTIDCEAEPYTNVNCTLTQTSSEVRTKPSDEGLKGRIGAVQSIATSSAKNDSGMFELNFWDERYLPFEGAGAISKWRIELPQDCNRIDIQSIKDVVIHLHYSAREGGEALRNKAKGAVLKELSNYPLGRIIDVKQEFSQAWDTFIQPADKKDHVLNLALNRSLFPAMFRSRKIQITDAWFFLMLKDTNKAAEFSMPFTLKGGKNEQRSEFKKIKENFGLHCACLRNNLNLGEWQIKIGKDKAKELHSVENALIWIWYKVGK